METTTGHPAPPVAAMRAPVIEAEGLHRRYGGRPGYEAVRGVDFTVAPGELFALLGTNGAGKTSTLEVIEGLAAPTEGSVRVLGRDPRRDRALVRPHLGIMLQSGGFPQDLSVAETAQMWGGTLTTCRPIGEALALVSMSERAHTPVRQLSGGERRRLDLAMALLGRPSVLFLDEPTTGLDPESRRDAWHLIRDLRDAGTTVVLTTHYLDEAEELADHLAIMHRGEVVTTGTVDEVVAGHPSTISFAAISHGGPHLPSLPGATVDTDHGTTTVHTPDLQPTLAALLRWAEDERVALDRLRAQSASLESVFLSVAGDSAGDGGHDAAGGQGTPTHHQEEAA